MVAAADDMVLDEGHEQPLADVAHRSCSPMIWGDLLMKSFAVFRLQMMILWRNEVFAEVDATIFRQVPTGVDAITE